MQEIGGPVEIWRPEGWLRALRCLGTGAHCYNVQITVDTEHHLIVAHEVTNSGSDRAQLANMAKQAKGALKTETLEAVADRGYFSGPEILACHEAGITVTLPKPQASGAKSEQCRPCKDLESTLPFMLSDASDHCQCCGVESNVRTMASRSTRKPPLGALF